jgi:DNA-binding transcriptional LysR family regulator
MADTAHAIETARRAARGEVGRLDIAYIGALSDVLIPRLLREFRSRFPHVAVTLQHLRPAAQIAALLSGRIHLGFAGQPDPEYDTQLSFEVFRRDPMQVALPSRHPLLARKQIRLADLSKEKFVCLTRAGSPHYYDWMMKLCHEAGFHPQVVQEVEHRQTATELVAAGYGVALFPATAQHWIQEDVMFRPVKGMPLYEHAVAWRRGDEPPAIQAFLSLLREQVGSKQSARHTEREGSKAPA